MYVGGRVGAGKETSHIFCITGFCCLDVLYIFNTKGTLTYHSRVDPFDELFVLGHCDSFVFSVNNKHKLMSFNKNKNCTHVHVIYLWGSRKY